VRGVWGKLAAGRGVAGFEGVAGVAAGARAHGGMVLHVAVRALSAHGASRSHARVLALVLVAGLVGLAVSWACALSRGAGQQWVADERVWACAHGSLLIGAAVSTRGAHSAGATGVGLAQVGISKWSA